MGGLVTFRLAASAAVVALLSRSHAIGLIGLVLIVHGILVLVLGASARNLPFFVAVCVVGLLIMLGRWKVPPPHQFLLLLALVLWMGLCVLLAPDEERAFLQYLRYIKAIALALIVTAICHEAHGYEIIAKFLLVGLVTGAAFNLYQHLTGQYLLYVEWMPERSRATGLRGDPNDTAMILMMGMPLAWYFFYSWRDVFWRMFAAGAFFLIAAAIILTGSRAGGLVMVALLALLFARRPSMTAAIAGVFLVLGMMLWVADAYWERMGTLIEGEDAIGGTSLAGRWTLLTQGLSTFSENPIFGVGIGHFGGAFPDSLAVLTTGGTAWGGPVAHNLYLEVFVEAGLVGGALFVTVLAMSVIGLRRLDLATRPRDARTPTLAFAFMSGLLGMLMMGMTLSQGHSSVLWFVVGLGLAARNISIDLASERVGADTARQPPVAIAPRIGS
ncbi:MAG: O-antigen ligase family protein [Rhodospirillales bacterium]|nr:MAG: O-antigen ligase family protein [Rhodospirillales bacterium]